MGAPWGQRAPSCALARQALAVPREAPRVHECLASGFTFVSRKKAQITQEASRGVCRIGRFPASLGQSVLALRH